MGKKIAGTCYVKVDGEQLSLNGSLSIRMNEVTREAIMGSTGLAGFSEVASAPTISGTFNITPDFPLQTLMSQTDMTVTAECANGMTFTLSGAFVSGDTDFAPNDGTATLTFTGEKGNWS